MTSGPRVVVLGGINMDLVARSDRFPRPGETIQARSIETTPGGKGANQAIAAARALGVTGAVAMVGRVGDDLYGSQLCAYMEASGVDASRVGVAKETASGLAIIAVDGNGENTVTAAYGANSMVDGSEVLRLGDLLDDAEWLLVQLETPMEATVFAMHTARDAGVRVLLDPAPARPMPEGFPGLASILTPNQTEAEALSGVTVTDVASASRAARRIREQYGVETVIVTLGEMGALVLGPEGEFHTPAFPVTAVATVGAGDSFNGALAAALVEGMALEEAVRFASAAAAVCVTREGAAASMPERGAILAMLAGR